MISRRVLIVIVILVIVGLGLFFVSNMTGNVVTGLTISGGDNLHVNNEYFRISDFGANDVSRMEVKDGA